MAHLTDFITWMNEEVGGNGPLPNLMHGDYGEAMYQSLGRHFAEDRQRGGVRMSKLGYPAAILALARLGYVEPEPKGKSRLIFHMGDMFENFLEVMMQTYGIEILDSQRELTWNGGIKGHLDYIIKSPVTGQPIVVEAKTMSENYARMFSRQQNDDRGYISQLALYTDCTGMEGTWICLNKGNAELFEITPAEGLFEAARNRAAKVLERIEKVNTLDDVLAYDGGQFQLPPPRPERYKNAETGRMILPPSMSFSPFKSALYKLTDDYNQYKKPTKYVEGYADTEHMKRELDFLVREGVIIYDPL